MRFLILGRDIPLAHTDIENIIENSEVALKEPLNNEYDENCKERKSSGSKFNKDNLHKTEETEIGVKPILHGPVV